MPMKQGVAMLLMLLCVVGLSSAAECGSASLRRWTPVLQPLSAVDFIIAFSSDSKSIDRGPGAFSSTATASGNGSKNYEVATHALTNDTSKDNQ
jgi:hypothetical protein